VPILAMDAARDPTHIFAAGGSPHPESLQTGLQQLKMQVIRRSSMMPFKTEGVLKFGCKRFAVSFFFFN